MRFLKKSARGLAKLAHGGWIYEPGFEPTWAPLAPHVYGTDAKRRFKFIGFGKFLDCCQYYHFQHRKSGRRFVVGADGKWFTFGWKIGALLPRTPAFVLEWLEEADQET